MHFQLKNIELNLHLGVPEEERKIKQKILISVFFKADTTKSEISDNIADTVNYQIIYDVITEFEAISEKNPYKLLEKLHKDILEKISSEMKKNNFKIKNLKLQIEKFPFLTGSIIISD